MEHTPEKWEIQEHGGLFAIGTYDDTICKLWELEEETHNKLGFENAEANAYLIAAAPDLLAACKRMLGSMGCDELNNGRVFDDDLRKEVKEAAKQAIAKAEKEE